MILLSLLSAALPYAGMVWRSYKIHQSASMWCSRLAGFWFYPSGLGVDVSPSAGWWDRWEFLQWFSVEAFWLGLTPLGFELASGVWKLMQQLSLAVPVSGI